MSSILKPTMQVEDQVHEKLERMRQEITGQKGPVRNPTAPADPYDMKEHSADCVAGRDRRHYDKWRQVMEYHGFFYLLPSQVDRIIGPKSVIPGELAGIGGNVYVHEPHTEAQWRRFGKPQRMAGAFNVDRTWAETFTPKDLISLFEDVPESFDRWMRQRDVQRLGRERGIKILRERSGR